MNKKIKSYVKAGMGIYTLIVLVYIVSFYIIMSHTISIEYSGTAELARFRDYMDSLSVLGNYILLPYLCICAVIGVFYFVKWFIYNPLKEGSEI